jgi:hypothetical protein
MKKIIFALVLLPALFLIPSSCKKGADDPFISLRPRKSRIAKEWMCNSFSGRLTSVESGNTYVGGLNYSGSTLTVSETNYPTYYVPYSLRIRFDKDGKFTATELYDSESIYVEGTWNFTGKIGEEKNKESVSITITRSIGSGTDGLFMLTGNTTVYHIKELRKDELVLTTDSYSYTDGADHSQLTGEFAFK